MKDELTKIIAEYLQENTVSVQDATIWHLQFKKEIDKMFLSKIAAEIAGKVLAVVEQKTGWEDAPQWAMWKLEYSDGERAFSKGYPNYITTEVLKIERRPK